MFRLLQLDATDSQTLNTGLQTVLSGVPASLLIASSNVTTIGKVQQSLFEALHQLPSRFAFIIGEQGCCADGYNEHSNLMISAMLFGHQRQEGQP